MEMKGESVKSNTKSFKIMICLFLCFGFMILVVFGVQAKTITAKCISANQNTDTSFIVSVNGIEATNGLNELTCNVWSSENSMDDIKTDAMTKNADNSYSFLVDMGQHHNDKGLYNIEIFGKNSTGTIESVGMTQIIIFTNANQWTRFEWDGTKLVEKIYRASVVMTPEVKSSLLSANKGASFKSGYGYSVSLNSTVTSNNEVSANTTLTGIQNAIITFPEFNYNKGVTINGNIGQYNRLAEITTTTNNANISQTAMELKENPFSSTNSRVHFTPLWYPNGNYTVYAETFDAWTPGGMLATTTTSNIEVSGNVYDDWQVNSK